ncbi:tRNA pseudouridine(38-40) synthase TruA [Alkaliflexus imshenetskii]|jgi:tRNA pseudouridine38-40 synthase|uniref:tRNA pseudouridine(38-40) synthase TruA n=1 Tax=Alkaliflexus imshenetskii TaxID=286730 RepID=UPI0009FD023A|nr:tRNA pseudouridine(38-40) synthase TruA [Alkaliflexus imshenetskii]
MVRYFMELAYNGSKYHGWQRQPNGNSVQELLETALTTILRQPTQVTGAGRTDAGVHAAYIVAHFDTTTPIDDPMQLAAHISRFLPSDVVVYSVTPVNDEAHSRFSAIARRYEYHVTTEKNPFLQGLAARLRFVPDFDKMNQAAAILLEYSDFTSFSRLHGSAKTNICKVQKAIWEQSGHRYIFTIEADRFLRNMVRAIVGTLLDVGRGKLTIDQFREIIELKDRSRAGTSAPAEGLYLVDVTYPPEVFVPSRRVIV